VLLLLLLLLPLPPDFSSVAIVSVCVVGSLGRQGSDIFRDAHDWTLGVVVGGSGRPPPLLARPIASRSAKESRLVWDEPLGRTQPFTSTISQIWAIKNQKVCVYLLE
jgi:hypothetical protein